MKLSIFRYNPDRDGKPYMQDYELDPEPEDRMLLDVILRIRMRDDSLAIRKSCREGVCGSDAININGRNGLACITPVAGLKEPVVLRPLPSFPVIRDLIVDMTRFFIQYHSIKPYLINDEPAPEKERLQPPRRARKAERFVRMHPVRVLHEPVPAFVVEPGQVRRAGGLVASLSLHRRQPRPRDAGAPRRFERSLPPVPLPLDHELHRGLSQRPGAVARDREDQADDDRAFALTGGANP